MSGDAAACRGTAEQLRRAGAEVRRDADRWRAVRSGVPSWTGEAAAGWAATVSDSSDAGRELSDRIGLVAGVVARHADGLEQLQSRARALREQARDADLQMDDDGGIPPFPLTGYVSALASQQALRTRPGADTWQLREDLLRRAAVLRDAVRSLHDELARELSRLDAPAPRSSGGSLLGGWWALPPVVADGVTRALAVSAAAGSGAAAAGRAASRAIPGLGMAYGVVVDVAAEDRSLLDAVLRNGAAAGAGAGAAAAVVALAPAAVAAAPVLIPVAVAGGVGLGAAALYDAVRGRDEPDEQPDRRRPRPSPGPAPRGPGAGPAPSCPPPDRCPTGPEPRAREGQQRWSGGDRLGPAS